ncbi:MAG: ferric iron reductase [Chloroflexaceae bacterium]|jgi:siderophore synthetase component|nr:ferric iron reductase [Chloroflexaceae bacterium]
MNLLQQQLEARLATVQAAAPVLEGRLLLADLPPQTQAVPTADLLDPTRLRPMLEMTAAHFHVTDLRVAATVVNRAYSAATLIGTLVALAVGGVALDASLSNTQLVLRDGFPHGLLIQRLESATIYQPRFGPALPPGVAHAPDLAALHRAFYATAIDQHLAPHMAALRQVARLGSAVMWGNVGTICNGVYQAMQRFPPLAQAAHEDRGLIFGPTGPSLAGPGPLARTMRSVSVEAPGHPEQFAVRTTCCVLYKLPTRSYCLDCPKLAPEERMARQHQLDAAAHE